MTQGYSDHMRIDERNRARDELIARRLRATPKLIDVARDNIARWHALHGETAAAHQEWAELLDGPLEQVINTLMGRDGKSERLRQSNPFAGIITQDERRAFNESYSARTHHQGR